MVFCFVLIFYPRNLYLVKLWYHWIIVFITYSLCLIQGSKILIIVVWTVVYTNISMHILHTVLETFPKMPTWRICLTIKNFSSRWMFDSVGIWKGEIRCQSLLGVKLLNTWSFLISVKLFAGLSAACVALGFDPFCWVKKYPCQRANNEALLTDDLTFFWI